MLRDGIAGDAGGTDAASAAGSGDDDGARYQVHPRSVPAAWTAIAGHSARGTASAYPSVTSRLLPGQRLEDRAETASNRAPASTRSIASTPDAMPAFAAGIAAIAAVDIGA